MCAFGSWNWTAVPGITRECYERYFTNANWSYYDSCARGQSGINLMNSYSDIISDLSPQLVYVPWITVNGVHDIDAEENLLQRICYYYYQVRCVSSNVLLILLYN